MDAWGKKDVRAILDSLRHDMDRRETEVLKKDEGYHSQFWAYLDKIVYKSVFATFNQHNFKNY